MRRFAIVEIPAPTAAQWASILGPHASTGVPTWDAALKQLVTSAASPCAHWAPPLCSTARNTSEKSSG